MTLREEQSRFIQLVGQLIAWVYANPGWELTFGEAWRSAHEALWDAQRGLGIARSLHTIRLAVDINFFINGVYQTTSDACKPIGDYWKSLDPANRWGGDFTRKDGNHYSREHDGVQ